MISIMPRITTVLTGLHACHRQMIEVAGSTSFGGTRNPASVKLSGVNLGRSSIARGITLYARPKVSVLLADTLLENALRRMYT